MGGWAKKRLEELHALGFDESRYGSPGTVMLKCSQCEATFINGVPCHEHGCPNKKRNNADHDDASR